MQKIERLLAIILTLKKNKRLTAKELAQIFEVDVRTIYRDMQALGEMNIPIISYPGNEGGYEILDSYFIPPIMFNKDEVFALLLSKKIIDTIDIPGFSIYSNSAFLKIENLVSDCFKRDFEDVQKRIVFDIKNNEVEIKDSRIFYLIKQALKYNNKMKIKYRNSFCVKEEIINPYGLVFEDGIWYIVVFSEINKSKFNINIETIEDIIVLEETFNFPSDFSMVNYHSPSCFKNQNKNESGIIIRLKVSRDLYPKIKDYVYFKYGNVTEIEDYYIIEVKTTNVDLYISLAFRFFNGIEILEPLWIRNKFKEELFKLSKAYGI